MTTHYDAQDLRAIENSNLLRSDANETIFFARQLEYVKSRTYDIKRPDLSAFNLFPVDTSAGAGAKTITYRQYDSVGSAKIIASYAEDLPRADVVAKEFTSNVRGIGVSYGYDVQEIRYAQMTGQSLDAKRAASTRKAHEQKVNQLAWSGDADHGLPGFLTNANVPGYTIPADGTGSSKLFSNKTPDQILRDLNGLANAVYTQSKGVHRPNQLWIPLAQYTYIASTPRSSTSDTTILDYFLMSNRFIKEVVPVLELASNANGGVAGATNIMVAVENTEENLQMNITMPFMQHSPQQKGLAFEVPCESRFGGVTITYPLAMIKADSI